MKVDIREQHTSQPPQHRVFMFPLPPYLFYIIIQRLYRVIFNNFFGYTTLKPLTSFFYSRKGHSVTVFFKYNVFHGNFFKGMTQYPKVLALTLKLKKWLLLTLNRYIKRLFSATKKKMLVWYLQCFSNAIVMAENKLRVNCRVLSEIHMSKLFVV